MKRIFNQCSKSLVLFVIFSVVCVAFASSAQAQKNASPAPATASSLPPKFGYVAADQIIFAMPETRKVDSLLRKYKTDSLDALLPYMISEYTRKDSMSKIEKNPIIKRQTESEAAQLRQQLENWTQITQTRMQEKQNQLLSPLYQKVSDAITDLAKKENYTYIFRAESLLYAPEGENVSEKILKKLGITISPDMYR